MHSGKIDPTTTDGFLGGRLRLHQPADGYRAGGDPIFLAAHVAAKPGQTVLDLGAGVGTAGLCLLSRCPGITLTALELDPGQAALARANAADNGFADRMEVIEGDALAGLGGRCFDHVITNPPWLPEGTSRRPRSATRSKGHMEGEGGLAAWVRAAVRALAPKGTLTLIHRADRLADLLALLDAAPVGGLQVTPLWPKAGRPALRVIVAARRGGRAPFVLQPGIVLHDEDGRHSREAQAILTGAFGEPE